MKQKLDFKVMQGNLQCDEKTVSHWQSFDCRSSVQGINSKELSMHCKPLQQNKPLDCNFLKELWFNQLCLWNKKFQLAHLWLWTQTTLDWQGWSPHGFVGMFKQCSLVIYSSDNAINDFKRCRYLGKSPECNHFLYMLCIHALSSTWYQPYSWLKYCYSIWIHWQFQSCLEQFFSKTIALSSPECNQHTWFLCMFPINLLWSPWFQINLLWSPWHQAPSTILLTKKGLLPL